MKKKCACSAFLHSGIRGNHKAGGGSGQLAAGLHQFGFQAVQNAVGARHAGMNFECGITGDRMKETHIEFTGDGFNVLMKQAMSHGRIQQRRNNAAVKNACVPLKQRIARKDSMYAAVVSFFKPELQAGGIGSSADNAVAVAMSTMFILQ